MNFKNPYFLLLLILPAILYPLKILLKTEKPPLKISYYGIPSPTYKVKLMKYFAFWAKLISMLLIIVALARPQKIEKGEIPPAAGIDILLCLDTSYSMAAEDFKPNRFEAAKRAAIDFVRKRVNDRVGLVVFGGEAVLTCPLTLDHKALKVFIENTYVTMVDTKGTAIGDGIITAINHLKNSPAKSKVIILLTDGRSNTGLIQDPVYAAKLAKTFNIKIYAVGTAGKGKARIPTQDPFMPYTYIDDDLDEATLMEIAAVSGGRFYRAKNNKELRKIYSEIDAMEKTEFKVRIYSSYTDLYLWFLMPAAFLLFLLFLAENLLLPGLCL